MDFHYVKLNGKIDLRQNIYVGCGPVKLPHVIKKLVRAKNIREMWVEYSGNVDGIFGKPGWDIREG